MADTAFLFSGQGAQYPGMMGNLFSEFPEAAALLHTADSVLGIPLSEVIAMGPADELNKTRNTQPALLTCEVAALTVLRSSGVRADCLAGFSLGEWSALVAGGVISFEDGLRIVSKRAEAMQTAVPEGEGAMAVVLGKSADEVEALCRENGAVTPSNYNCPGQITIAGTADGIGRFMTAAAERGIVAKQLAISVPSHCWLMKPAAEALAAELERVSFRDSALPIVMNCTAEAEQRGSVIKANMIRQLTEPVLFEKTVRRLFADGVQNFVEIGPGRTLAGLVKKTAKVTGDPFRTFLTDGAIEACVAELGGETGV